MEASFIFKEFFDRTLDNSNYETRDNNRFIDTSNRENYIFNSKINGIEETDFILMVGTNPRYESTMLNARIRKAYLNNKTKIISLNEIGDLTYPYESLDGKTQNILDIFQNKNPISEIIIKSKKPMIILGESFLNLKLSKFLFNLIKNFLLKNEKFSENWNPLNILSSDAATVGNLDLDIININRNLIKELKENKFELLYLLGQDNLRFDKKNEFIIYQGSHGDRGAEIADIILPGAAYTEQNGYFTNTEGKLQKAYKASYPPGEAKEDWQIINDLAELMNNRKLFNDKEELESSMFNYLKLKKDKQKSHTVIELNVETFVNEDLNIYYKDYYFSNVVARSSKTMLDCSNAKIDVKRTGTEG
tara:strand:- start:919 stop:2004 length:1086 start_codon:yes stop_codon:yes gene_type:complete